MNPATHLDTMRRQWQSETDYPVAEAWYQRLDSHNGITRIWEPHVHPLEQANFWHIRGSERDLLIDSGMGIVPLRESFPDLFDGKEIIAVATHTHIDHIGAIHEFEHRWVHAAEARQMEHPSGVVTLICSDIHPALSQIFVEAGYPPFDELLVDAFPHANFNPFDYRLRGAVPTRLLADKDVIDLGDKRFEILHLPGHSPGSICVWEEATGVLFTGDLIYDGPLVYEGPGMDLDIYAQSLRKLKELPVSVVHAGHDPSFDRARLLQIIDDYLSRWNLR
ncbi:MBL fold metallo-hydrolase [Paraburkholderia pallida]|uniref:MBL fold metallo-hydrolase n=1 Tax=Paraburkholderia pallida TaxID=2547399 RepID=A0A4P7D6Y9_9BURK|nr:MBL fold metallo-hydrolase [Paraburkholderia pallida]QBR03257.1 MBL fold metallo-hydrolase [Paraburkholderia pallida]